MEQVLQVDLAPDERHEQRDPDQDREAADGPARVRLPLIRVPAKEQQPREGGEREEHLDDEERREDVVPERRGEPAALAAARAERPSVRDDRDDREQRGDDECERDETAPENGWSFAGPTF
jgi:hypothetical protein